MLLARDIIESGGIPSREQYSAEGLFSEHDLSIDGEPCAALLCPRVAMAQVQTIGTSEPELLAQLGFATHLSPENFERENLDLVVAVDISGSMAGEKLGATRQALRSLVDQLHASDRLGIVAFDDRVSVRAELTTVDEAGREALLRRIEALEANGGTWIEGGLQAALEMADAEPAEDGVAKRVMILTDAQPNIGATDPESFLGLARTYAHRDIGLTSFGIGLDLGAELTSELAKIRGGNSFTLSSREAIERVFETDFDYMVTPVAYDLDVDVLPSAELAIGDSFGAPTDPAGEVRFGASTLFLSSRGGGMGIKLVAASPDEEPLPGGEVAMSLSYEDATSGEQLTDEVVTAFAGGAAFQLLEDDSVVHAADDAGVFTMAVLIDELAVLDMAADFCTNSESSADTLEAIARAAARLEQAREVLSEDALAEEAALLWKLAANVRGGVGNCHY
jgi:Ca-activated chloride channel family protein